LGNRDILVTPRDALSIAEIRALLATTQGRKLTALLARLAEDDRAGVQALLEAARGAGLTMEPENIAVDDGLSGVRA